MAEQIQKLLDRVSTYPLWEIGIEFAIIAVALYLIIRFLRGTRGAGIIKGLALLLIIATLAVQILGGEDNQSFQRLAFLYNRSLAFLAIGFLVIFQPELRRALIKLGEASFFHRRRQDVAPIIESVVEACDFLARNRIGAIIALERQIGLGAAIEGGTLLDAHVSARLLQTIFWPNSALHDLGVVIRQERVVAAGVQFPMAEQGELDGDFGSRHRAALGVTLESDCIAVVVSEERGEIRIAESGKLSDTITADRLRNLLLKRLSEPTTQPDQSRRAEDRAPDPQLENPFDGADDKIIPEPEEPTKTIVSAEASPSPDLSTAAASTTTTV